MSTFSITSLTISCGTDLRIGHGSFGRSGGEGKEGEEGGREERGGGEEGEEREGCRWKIRSDSCVIVIS